MRSDSVTRRLVVTLLLACLGAALLAGVAAAPAGAFVTWGHDGIPSTYDPASCAWCHGENGTGPATNESCTSLCHRDFKVTADATVAGRFPQRCWSCHAPGADTSGYGSSSEACSQDCHLYSPADKLFTVAYAHGPAPHLGASAPYGQCLDCHSTSVTWSQPGSSPHHDGVQSQAPTCERCHNDVVAGAQQTHDGAQCEGCHEGMDYPDAPEACLTCHAAATFGSADCLTCHAGQVHDTSPSAGSCTTCHTGYAQHAGKVSCTSCHTNAAKSHHGTAAAAVKTCRSCHAVKHAGAKVSGARCADCHKGSTPSAKPRVQHSTTIRTKLVCSGCHAKKLHAKAEGAKTTCRSCHKGKYHAAQAKVASAACLRCHGSARRHSGGIACVRCHKKVVHDPTP